MSDQAEAHDHSNDEQDVTRDVLPDILIGGRYRPLALLNQGGMGEIYVEDDTRPKRRLALKKTRIGKIPEAEWKRLEIEARAAAQLRHPNIVQVFDLGLDDDEPYFVMELLEGESLAHRLTRGPIEENLCLGIFKQIAAGLSAAHTKGIIHRDVKPGNIMLLPSNNDVPNVKVVDFGLAKIVSGVRETSQQLTATGQVMGSPIYMRARAAAEARQQAAAEAAAKAAQAAPQTSSNAVDQVKSANDEALRWKVTLGIGAAWIALSLFGSIGMGLKHWWHDISFLKAAQQ